MERKVMAAPPLRGAVFLDRDGTIIQEVNYLDRLEDIKLLTQAGDAIAKLNRQQIPVILVTNQSGIARGKFTGEFVQKSHHYLQQLLQVHEAHIDDFFYCPHHPKAGNATYKIDCNCRKPAPGMLLDAAEKHHLDLERSFVIGDKLIDVELGLNCGAIGILVETGYGEQEKERAEEGAVRPNIVCKDLNQAIEWILKQRKDNLTFLRK